MAIHAAIILFSAYTDNFIVEHQATLAFIYTGAISDYYATQHTRRDFSLTPPSYQPHATYRMLASIRQLRVNLVSPLPFFCMRLFTNERLLAYRSAHTLIE